MCLSKYVLESVKWEKSEGSVLHWLWEVSIIAILNCPWKFQIHKECVRYFHLLWTLYRRKLRFMWQWLWGWHSNTFWYIEEKSKILTSLNSWLSCKFTNKRNDKEQGLGCVASCHLLTVYPRAIITRRHCCPECFKPNNWFVIEHIVVILLTCSLVMTLVLPVILLVALYDL